MPRYRVACNEIAGKMYIKFLLNKVAARRLAQVEAETSRIQ